MVEVNHTIYYQKLNQGIFKIENGRETLVSDHEILKTNRIINIYNIEGQFIIQTNQKGFFVLEEDGIYKWDNPANETVSNVTVYSSIRLKNGGFAIGTISNGIINITEKGDIDYKLNQNNGLSNNTVLSVFEDQNENIWLGLDSGINCINSASPFKVFDDKKGVLGAVHASVVFEDKLYIGTNQGLFEKPLNSANDFEIITETKGQVWFLDVIDGTLFCGHDLGTFVITNESIEHISDLEGTWSVKQVPNNDNLLVTGSYSGLSVLENVNGKWQYRNKVEGFDISSKFFEILETNQIFVSHEYKGVFKLDINNDYTKVTQVAKDNTVRKGLHASLVKYNSDILYAYKEGVFAYDTTSNTFVKDTILSKLYDSETYVSGKLVNTPDKLWSFSERNISYVSPGLLSDVPQINRIPLSRDLRASITGYENIISIDHNIYLLGASSGYILIDLDKMKEHVYQVKINSIYNYTLDSEKKLIQSETPIEFHNKQNNFEFTYSIAEFDKYLEAEYQYKLEGNYNKWSSWSQTPNELFKNLPHGDYVFSVRGRVGNQITDNVASYTFSIEKPWYLSNLMVLLYILSVVLFSIIMHNIYKRKYKTVSYTHLTLPTSDLV